MRKMKDSGIDWIGEIPKEWKVGKVKDVFIRKNEKAKQENPVVLSLARSGVKIRDITNRDEINFDNIGKKKTCVFVITSDTNSTFDFLSTLFFSFLFIKLIKLADSMPDGRLPVETTLILDEFTNIGRILDVEKKISTTRSRLINICIIFQNIAQLKNRYDDDIWQEILGNCDTKICMRYW